MILRQSMNAAQGIGGIPGSESRHPCKKGGMGRSRAYNFLGCIMKQLVAALWLSILLVQIMLALVFMFAYFQENKQMKFKDDLHAAGITLRLDWLTMTCDFGVSGFQICTIAHSGCKHVHLNTSYPRVWNTSCSGWRGCIVAVA